MISDVVGADITLIDTGAAVARHLQRRIETELTTADSSDNSVHFYTSGDAAHASKIMSILWGEAVTVLALPQPYI